MRFFIFGRIASFVVAASAASAAAQTPASERIASEHIEVQNQPSEESLQLREPTLSVDVDVSLYLGEAEPMRPRRWFRRPVLFLAAGVAGLAASMVGLAQRSKRRAECEASMECELPWGRRDSIAAGGLGTSSLVMFGGLMGLVVRGLARLGRRIEAQQRSRPLLQLD